MSSAVTSVEGPDPRVSAALSVLPGLGQLYCRQPRKAAFYALTTVLSIGAAVLIITQGERVGHALLARHAGALFLLLALASVLVFLGLFLTGIFLWMSAAVDAWHSARAVRAGRAEEAASRRYFRL